MLDTNLKGTFFLSKEIGKEMIKQKRGKIINISSQMAFVGFYNRASYYSSKGGMVQLTKALAIEWASYGIYVNAFAPTFIETELTEKMFQDQDFKQEVLARIPLGELSKPKDVTDAVVFLASDFSNFITVKPLKWMVVGLPFRRNIDGNLCGCRCRNNGAKYCVSHCDERETGESMVC